MKRTRLHAARTAAAVLALAGATTAGALMGAMPANAGGFPAFVGPLHHITNLASTVPSNGDVNPYGVAVVPRTTGDLFAGDTLVSNFNNAKNVQGTGTTIVEITPSGHHWQFARINPGLTGCPGGVGLTTALTVLRSGWVIVGSLPTKGGNISGAGCLIVLDQWGHVRETFTHHGINGPWDMTAADYGHVADLFVTNVLNGTVKAGGKTVHGGTVLRLTVVVPGHGLPFIASARVIGSGFGEKTDPNALVIGPTGVGLGRNGTLYVADTVASRITAIPNAVFRGHDAGTGFTVTKGGHLNGELGLVVAPNGDILTVNGGNGWLVEVTPFGAQVATRQLDKSGSPPGAGALFGLAVKPGHRAVYFVDDATNTFELLH